MANEVVNRRLNIFIDDASAGIALQRLTVQENKLVASIEKGTKAGRDMVKEIARLDQVRGQIDGIKQAMEGKALPSLKLATAQVQALRRELIHLTPDTEAFNKKLKEIGAAQNTLDQVRAKVGGIRNAVKGAFSEIKSIALGVTIGNSLQAVVQNVAGFISGIVTNNARLSDELADIQKTTGLTAQDVADLDKQLRSIDTRTSGSRLRELAAEAGKLGKSTVSDVKRFVDEADKINVALGEDLGEGAIIQIGKLSNIFGTGMLNIASAINEIGAASEASESFQVDFLNRLAGVAPTAQLSADELLGYGAALESLGQSQEVSATALNKFFIDFVQNTENFGKSAGFAKGELTKLLQDKGTNAAFIAFLERLNSSSKSSQELLDKLKQLGIDGSRGAAVFLTLANNIERVKTQQEIANRAIQNGSSILNEFNKRNTTLGAELEKLSNRLSGLFETSALSKGLANLVSGINDLLEPAKSANQLFAETGQQVRDLETSITPLVNRYEELEKQGIKLTDATQKGTAEQEEMKNIISQIQSVLPGAVTQFDQYGNAISISTERVKDFIEAEKARLSILNRERIKETKDELEEVNKQLARMKDEIESIQKTGTFNVIESASAGVGAKPSITNRDATQEEIAEVQAKFKELLRLQKGYQRQLSLDQGDFLDDQLKQQQDAAKKEKEHKKKIVDENESSDDEEKRRLKEKQKELDEVRKELKKISDQITLDNLPRMERAVQQVILKYEELFKKAKGNTALTAEATRLMGIEIEKALNKFKVNPASIQLEDLTTTMEQATVKIATVAQKGIDKLLTDADQQEKQKLLKGREEIARLQLDVLNKTGRERLEAQKKLLDLEMKQEIEAKNLTTSEIELLEAQTKERQLELEKEFHLARLQLYLDFANQVVNLFNGLSQLFTVGDENRLQEEKARNDAQKESYKNQLDQKLISQKEYDKRIAQLDKQFEQRQAEIRKRQFKANQAAQITQALMSGAQAVVSTLAARPGSLDIISLGTFRAISIALVTAATLAQVAAIGSAKAPSYGGGGVLEGPSHQSRHKGLPVKNPETGQTVAYLEGGEGIGNKKSMQDRKTYRVEGTPSQIYSGLNALHGGVNWDSGATITPQWMTSRPRILNVPVINKSLQQVRYYQSGGQFAATPATTTTTSDNTQSTPAMSAEAIAIMSALLQRLNEPLYANVIYGEYEAKAGRITGIRDEGMIN